MARGQKEAADTQLNTTNAQAGTSQNQADKLAGELTPAYTSLMNNPLSDAQKKSQSGYSSMMDSGYLSPADEAAARTSEMGAATQPFESAGFQAAGRAGATRNASDLSAEETQLAMDKGNAAGGAAANLQKQKMSNQVSGMQGLDATGQQSIQNQLAAMYGIGGIEGENRSEAESMYGLSPNILNARAAGKSTLDQVSGLVSAASGFMPKG